MARGRGGRASAAVASLALAALTAAAATASLAVRGDATRGPGRTFAAGWKNAFHAHAWEPVYGTVEVPAATHVVRHGPEVGVEVASETVCNACGRVVTGATREHEAATGHAGFTADVPVEREVVLAEGWDEVVVDEPARSELVRVGDRCASCGAERPAGGGDAGDAGQP